MSSALRKLKKQKKQNGQKSPSIDQKSDRQLEERVVSQSTQTANQKAAQDDPMSDVEPEDFLEKLRSLGIESDEYDELEDILQPHLSDVLTTTYYDEEDRQKIELLNMALADRIIKERDSGRLCTGPFLEVAQDIRIDEEDGRTFDEHVKEPWKDHERRGVRTTIEEVRTALQYLSIDHVGLDKVADTTVENKTQVQRMDGDESSGRLSRATSKFFG